MCEMSDYTGMASINVCPKDQDKVQMAAKRLRCNKDIHGNNQYMCVPNKNKTSLVEFCYDGIMGLEDKGSCLEALSRKAVIRHNCTSFSSGCPNDKFLKSNVFKYPECQSINTKHRCYVSDPSCPPQKPDEQTSSLNTSVAISVSLGAFLIITVIAAIALYWFCIRKGSKTAKPKGTQQQDIKAPSGYQPVNRDEGQRIENREKIERDEEISVRDKGGINVGCGGAGKTTCLERFKGTPSSKLKNNKSTVIDDVHSNRFEVLEKGNTIKYVDKTPAVSFHSGMLQNEISNRTDELQIENLSESESGNDEREGTVNSILLVAAIDFGTTFSGYAFSFRHDYMNDPLRITTANWNAGSGGLTSLKTSTCILFNPTEKFDSFGYDAEERYSNLALDNEHHDWFYFRRFKMMLYNKKDLTRETLIEDDKGKKMMAIKVFSSAIRYIKDQLLNHCKKQMTGIDENDVEWVLTVPAIWNDNSKQFMREAAEKAHICRDKLEIALEPEAASLFCMHLPVRKDSVNFTYGDLKSGEKYMVVDAGGGTIDITIYQVKEYGFVKELYKASGGDWGGTTVDALFTSLLADIVGKDVMDTFSSIHKYDFLHMLTDFEVKKRTISPELNDDVTFTVPISLSDTFIEKNPRCSTDAASKSKYGSNLTWARDKLRINANITKSLFNRSCKQIVDHLKKLFMQPAVKDVSSILLVGGFAESPMLQTAIREAFKSKRVIIPKEAGLAVLKGAVICGHAPKTISGRVCKYTYGVQTTTTFDGTIHPKEKKIVLNGIEYCDDIFSIHVRIGQTVEVGEPQVKQTYVVTEPDQTSIQLEIYKSNNREPTYTTDKGCKHLGKLTIEMPDTSKGPDRGVIVDMTFSGTEIAVTAVDKDHPEKAVSIKVDFLG